MERPRYQRSQCGRWPSHPTAWPIPFADNKSPPDARAGNTQKLFPPVLPYFPGFSYLFPLAKGAE